MFWRERPAVVTARAHARAALAGNPSDGYGGRTIAFTFTELFADVTVKPAARLMIEAERGEAALLRAAYGRFAHHCFDTGADPTPCSLAVRSTIPPEVGLAASSAIIIAALQALSEFNGVELARHDLPLVALAAEEDLEIPAGLQDRVAQAYGGLVYMDFEPRLLASEGHGRYERLDPGALARAYVAWCPRTAVRSSRFHLELRRRYRSGEPEVIAALGELAELATEARAAIERHDSGELDRIVDANFELRRRLAPLEAPHVRLVEAARAAGASANYAGSGGAVTGFVADDRFAELTCALAAFGCTVIRPTVAVRTHGESPFAGSGIVQV